MDYNEQLQQPDWRWKRLIIFERDGEVCTQCNSNINLHCHHKLYCKGIKAWEYKDEYLITLCGKCHQELHDNNKIPVYRKWNDIKKFVLPEVKKRIENDVRIKKAQKAVIKRRTASLLYDIDRWVKERVFMLDNSNYTDKDLLKNIDRLDKAIIKYHDYIKNHTNRF